MVTRFKHYATTVALTKVGSCVRQSIVLKHTTCNTRINFALFRWENFRTVTFMPVSPKFAVQHFVELFMGLTIEVCRKLRTRGPDKELVNVAIARQLPDTPGPPDNQIETSPLIRFNLQLRVKAVTIAS